MTTRRSRRATGKSVVTFTHEEAFRRNIPTAEYQSLMDQDQQSPIQLAYQRLQQPGSRLQQP